MEEPGGPVGGRCVGRYWVAAHERLQMRSDLCGGVVEKKRRRGQAGGPGGAQ